MTLESNSEAKFIDISEARPLERNAQGFVNNVSCDGEDCSNGDDDGGDDGGNGESDCVLNCGGDPDCCFECERAPVFNKK